MRLRSLTHRRPSAAIVISSAALFMSLGGVGYAAVSIPNNSVGTNQIRNNAVSYKKIQPDAVGRVRLANGGVINSKLANNSVSFKKIQPGAVGVVRANLDQLQARLKKSCAAGTAVGAVDNKGNVTCNTTLPSELGVADSATATTLSGTPATVASVSLPASGKFLAFANPAVTVTSGATGQRVNISCALTIGTTVQTRTADVMTGAAGVKSTVDLNLEAAGATGTTASNGTVTCSASVPTGTLPATTATSPLSALAIATS